MVSGFDLSWRPLRLVSPLFSNPSAVQYVFRRRLEVFLDLARISNEISDQHFQMETLADNRACYEQHLKWRLESHLVDLHVIPMEFVKKLNNRLKYKNHMGYSLKLVAQYFP